MLPKRVTAAFWDNDLTTAHLLDVSSKGLDKWQMEKLGSDKHAFGTAIVPEKGYAFLHVITNGAGEYYGQNQNLDYFNEKEGSWTFPNPKKGIEKTAKLKGGLKEYHKTYRQYGGVYRNHKNSRKTDPETGKPFEKQGEIVDERYNEPMHRGEVIVKLPESKWRDVIEKVANGDPVCWSMGCFKAGTQVITSDGWMKPIETVFPGDQVLSHSGKSVEVTGIRKLTVTEDIYKVKVACILPIECTGNHQHWVIRKQASMVDSNHIRPDLDPEKHAEWVQTSDLQIGDYLILPRLQLGTETLPESLAKLVGWYLAEGYLKYRATSNSYSVAWSTHIDDSFKVDVFDLCNTWQTEHVPTVRDIPKANSSCITVTSRKLYSVCAEFGSGAYNKRFPANWQRWDAETLKTILGSYLEGDGCFYTKTDKAKPCSNLYASTCSEQFATQIQQIGLALGGFVSINRATHYSSKSATTAKGYTIEYQMRFDAFLTALLAPYCRKVTTIPEATTCGRNTRRIINNYAIAKVTAMEVQEETTDVFNLHVNSDEHSYLVYGMATHNCSTPAEICSVCGNVAKTLKQRCPCLRADFHKIAMDGNVAFAINDETYYHDISEVGLNPAMKIAYTMEKVATSGMVPRKPEFNDAGLWLPMNVIKQMTSASEYARYDLLQKLAKAERTEEPDEDLSEALEEDDDKCMHVADKLKGIPLDDLFSSLHKNHMMLSPKSFTVILIRNSKPGASDDEAGRIASGVPSKLRKIFSSIFSDPEEMEEVCSDGHYCPHCSFPNIGTVSRIRDLTDELSVEPPAIRKRIIIKIVRGGPEEKMEKKACQLSSAEDRIAGVVAKEYAKYQLAFLANAKGPYDFSNVVLAQNR